MQLLQSKRVHPVEITATEDRYKRTKVPCLCPGRRLPRFWRLSSRNGVFLSHRKKLASSAISTASKPVGGFFSTSYQTVRALRNSIMSHIFLSLNHLHNPHRWEDVVDRSTFSKSCHGLHGSKRWRSPDKKNPIRRIFSSIQSISNENGRHKKQCAVVKETTFCTLGFWLQPIPCRFASISHRQRNSSDV